MTAQLIADDPEQDGTDAAHPAFWRGEEYGAAEICREVNRVLDGRDDGIGVACEPWESTRRRLLAMVQNNVKLSKS